MVYDGYFRYDGIEIVNNARAAVYAETLRLGFFDAHHKCFKLDDALKERGWSNGGYDKPNNGNVAPWYDPLEPYSKGFGGMHLLSIENISSTTYSASIEEGVNDGGWIANGRYGTRSMLFKAILVGVDKRSVQHGFNWLTTVLRNGDPCRNSLRTMHTYDDFLPLGKKWWATYMERGEQARPDNLYQANRYVGLSTTDAPEVAPGEVGSGNTYQKLHSGGIDGLGQDALDILVPLSHVDPLTMSSRQCYGNTLEFFIQCPEKSTSTSTYRYMTKVRLTSGPTVIGEREVGGPDCAIGAWMEIEFTLTAANPFAWRWPTQLGFEDPDGRYRDVATEWLYYKETGDLDADDDVFQSPLVAGKPQTYAGFFNTVWERDAAVLERPAGRASLFPLVSDPGCPPVPLFPRRPQEDFLCRDINENGPFNTRRYSTAGSQLANYSPSAVKITLSSIIEECRDVRLRIIPQGSNEEPENIIELHVLYMPPMSTLVIDGVRRSIDILLADESNPSNTRWESADHLVVAHGGGASYRFPELLCGKEFVTELAIPVDQNPDVLSVLIEAVQRDA